MYVRFSIVDIAHQAVYSYILGFILFIKVLYPQMKILQYFMIYKGSEHLISLILLHFELWLNVHSYHDSVLFFFFFYQFFLEPTIQTVGSISSVDRFASMQCIICVVKRGQCHTFLFGSFCLCSSEQVVCFMVVICRNFHVHIHCTSGRPNPELL